MAAPIAKRQVDLKEKTNPRAPSPEEGSDSEAMLKMKATLDAVQNILAEYGKIHRGMKSRAFIGMFQALNKLGLFVNFDATDQEVSMTLPPSAPHPTGAHMEAHVVHRKGSGDKGLSGRTVKVSRHFVDALVATVSSGSDSDSDSASDSAGSAAAAAAASPPKGKKKVESGAAAAAKK
jgi:hypothetical protein